MWDIGRRRVFAWMKCGREKLKMAEESLERCGTGGGGACWGMLARTWCNDMCKLLSMSSIKYILQMPVYITCATLLT